MVKKREILTQHALAPGADPSLLLAGDGSGGGGFTTTPKVRSEDDVLHLPAAALPTFGGALRPRDAELLLCYLTAPYCRIPLLLRFFAEPARFATLVTPALQDVLDAALFEPARWRRARDGLPAPPSRVPDPDGFADHLATPAGLLVNELQRSPANVIDAIDTMLALAFEVDTGKPDGGASAAILYATRLASRVLGYMVFLEARHVTPA